MSKQHNSDKASELAPETMFSLLSDERRRNVCSFLSKQNTAVSLEEIADAIASDADDGSRKSRDQVAATLHHVHLPKLADADIISYDAETNTVTTEGVDAVAPYVVTESGEA